MNSDRFRGDRPRKQALIVRPISCLAVGLAWALAACSGSSDAESSPPSSNNHTTGLLENAYTACSTGENVDWKAYGSQAPLVEDVIQLSDDGNTISIKTPRTQGEDLGNLGYWVGECVLRETGAPKSVFQAMVKANFAGSFDLHKKVYDASTVPATISFEWYDHESERGTSWDATFHAEPR